MIRTILYRFCMSIAIAVVIHSCGNSQQTKAVELAKQIQLAIKPGALATTISGYTMKAKINGKNWVASSMMPPDVAGRIIGYYNNEYIGLPYNRSDLVAGKKIIIGEDNAADLLINNGCLWKDIKGEIVITKVDDNAAEGEFLFTSICNSTNEVVKITDGFFRLRLTKKL
jgi:hypothetical protein